MKMPAKRAALILGFIVGLSGSILLVLSPDTDAGPEDSTPAIDETPSAPELQAAPPGAPGQQKKKTRTPTPAPRPTRTPTASSTSIATSTPTSTNTPTVTSTVTPTITSTATSSATPTATSTPTSTSTVAPTATPTATSKPPTPAPTSVPVLTPTTAPTPVPVIDLQAAINAAHCGDTIVIQAGATYTGAFALPEKPNCTAWTTITSNGRLPPSGTRLDPAKYGSQLAKIVGIGNYPTFYSKNISSRWKLVGLDIRNSGTAGSYTPIVVTFGGGDSISGGYPTHDARTKMGGWVDRCFVHPVEISATNLATTLQTRTAERGIQANVYGWWVVDSYIAGFANTSCCATEGILVDADSGDGHIVNNYIEAWYSNIFIGGSDMVPNATHQATVSNAATIGTVTLSTVQDLQVGDLVAFQCASCAYKWEIGKVSAVNPISNVVSYYPQVAKYQDFNSPPDTPGLAQWRGYQIDTIEIRKNSLVKRPEWSSFGFPKNWIEIKAGMNVTIDGNTMTSPVGTNIALTVRNQNGSSPWVLVGPLIFANNIVYGFANSAFGILLQDNEKVTSTGSGNFTIANNLLLSTDGQSMIFGVTRGHDVAFIHNTIETNAKSIGYGQDESPGFILRDNILTHGRYGLSCYIGSGGGTLDQCFPSRVLAGNVIVDTNGSGTAAFSSWYPGNSYAASYSAVGFTDQASANYRLAPTSPYKGKASDGKDPGIDQDALEAALDGTPMPMKMKHTPHVKKEHHQ